MSLIKLLREVTEILDANNHDYAVVGGLAASVYRKKLRLTNDIDIALSASNVEQAKEIACDVIKQLNYHVGYGWISDDEQRLDKAIALVIGKKNKNSEGDSVDFLLPVLPWVNEAVSRAQDNCLDFGFAKLPTVTPEDLILAKVFALSMNQERYTDYDDIKEMFKGDNQLDLAYLVSKLEGLKLTIPKELLKYAPDALKRMDRRRAGF